MVDLQKLVGEGSLNFEELIKYSKLQSTLLPSELCADKEVWHLYKNII